MTMPIGEHDIPYEAPILPDGAPDSADCADITRGLAAPYESARVQRALLAGFGNLLGDSAQVENLPGASSVQGEGGAANETAALE